MANEIKIFENEEFGSVRTMEINGEPYFVGKDVATILGYSNINKAIQMHVDEEDKKVLDYKGFSHFGTTLWSGNDFSNKTIINESGLYSLILSSKLPKAKEFKHWVTSEILPSIRKTGGYLANSDMMVSTYFGNLPPEQQTLVKGLFDNIIAQQTKIDTLTTTNEVLTTDILSWADRPLVNALVRRYAGYACDGNFASAWIEFKKELLYKYSININSRITAYINKNGKKPHTLDVITDDEVLSALKTIVSLCENKNIDISDLLNKHKAS